ncbi:hypothetical protein D3C81_1012760 [compost metagenome]
MRFFALNRYFISRGFSKLIFCHIIQNEFFLPCLIDIRREVCFRYIIPFVKCLFNFFKLYPEAVYFALAIISAEKFELTAGQITTDIPCSVKRSSFSEGTRYKF